MSDMAAVDVTALVDSALARRRCTKLRLALGAPRPRFGEEGFDVYCEFVVAAEKLSGDELVVWSGTIRRDEVTGDYYVGFFDGAYFHESEFRRQDAWHDAVFVCYEYRVRRLPK